MSSTLDSINSQYSSYAQDATSKTEQSSFSAREVSTNEKVQSSILDQEDFLKLLTTQLACQDPTQPVDNNQMVTQMSQLSMVESLNTINSNMEGVIQAVTSSSALTASSLVGRSVLVDAKAGFFDGLNPMQCKINAGDGVSDVKIVVKDSSGQIVDEFYASSGVGDMEFSWDGVKGDGSSESPETTPTEDGEGGTDTGDGSDTDGDDSSGSDSGSVDRYPAGMYTIEATAVQNGQTVSLPVQMYATVGSVTLGKNYTDTVLNLIGYGDVTLDQVKEIAL